MPGSRRPQETGARAADVAPGAASATAVANAACASPCADRIERRERADEKIVARRRQPGSESDQALNRDLPGMRWRRAPDNQRSNIAMRVRATRASGVACASTLRARRAHGAQGLPGASIAARRARAAQVSISRAGGGQTGQGGGRHDFALVEREPNRIADRDVADRRPRPISRLQREIATRADVSDQRQRTIADIRFADTDECVAGAEIEDCVRKRPRPSRAQRCGRIPAPERRIAGSAHDREIEPRDRASSPSSAS